MHGCYMTHLHLASLLILLAPGLLWEWKVGATSVKMDFLPLTHVRSDPIVTPGRLSAHLHTFFGANIASTIISYDDLRNEMGNTGNVLENHSLYWYPTIYRQDPSTGRFIVSPIFLNSAYYIWENRFSPRAFPDGFKMIGGGIGLTKWQTAVCSNQGSCPNGNCTTTNDFFPPQACEELEISMQMPSCWDGTNIDSPDHRSHVAYVNNADECPASHPIQIPRVHIFARIRPYLGGVYMFSDGSGYFHSDYFSGWEANFLQSVMNNCENDSFGPNPDAFCDNFLTFRDVANPPKTQSDDLVIVSRLEQLQPSTPFNPDTVSTEQIDNVAVLPGGNRITRGTFVPTTAAPVASGPQPGPTRRPTRAPTRRPTRTPTRRPTRTPTPAPTPGSPTRRPTPRPTPMPTPGQIGSNVVGFGVVFQDVTCEQGPNAQFELRQLLLMQEGATDATVDPPICASVRLNAQVSFVNVNAANDFNDLLTSTNGINKVFGPGTTWNDTMPDNITSIVIGTPDPDSDGGSGGGGGSDSLPIIIGAVVGAIALFLMTMAGYWFGYREESRLACCNGGSDTQGPKAIFSPEPKMEVPISPRGNADVVSSAQHLNIVQNSVSDMKKVGEIDKSFYSPTALAGAKLPEGWTQHVSEQGAVYYYNSETGESTWTKPK